VARNVTGLVLHAHCSCGLRSQLRAGGPETDRAAKRVPKGDTKAVAVEEMRRAAGELDNRRMICVLGFLPGIQLKQLAHADGTGVAARARICGDLHGGNLCDPGGAGKALRVGVMKAAFDLSSSRKRGSYQGGITEARARSTPRSRRTGASNHTLDVSTMGVDAVGSTTAFFPFGRADAFFTLLRAVGWSASALEASARASRRRSCVRFICAWIKLRLSTAWKKEEEGRKQRKKEEGDERHVSAGFDRDAKSNQDMTICPCARNRTRSRGRYRNGRR
jgi:hypothetical protein